MKDPCIKHNASPSCLENSDPHLPLWGPLSRRYFPPFPSVTGFSPNLAMLKFSVSLSTSKIRDLHQEWPHTNLLGRNCSVKYVNIALHQLNLGFINLITTFLERDPEKARHMLAVFKSYQEDLAAGYEFPLVRATHLAFLTSMEQGKLEWSDLGELRMLSQSIIWNPPPPPRNAPRIANPTAAKIRTPADPKSPPCIAYNTSAGCSKQSPHNNYHHICEHCFTVRGLSFGHSKAACYSLHGPPKDRMTGLQIPPPPLCTTLSYPHQTCRSC